MVAMRIQEICCFLFVVTLVFPASSFGQYSTPGTGEIYSFQDLVPLSGGILEETDFGFVLRDQLTVSAGDTLLVSGGELFLATRELRERTGEYGTHYADIMPALIVEGSLDAEAWTLSSVPGTERFTSAYGLIVSGIGTPAAATADIRNCTFSDVSVGLTVRGNTSVTVQNSRFIGCFNSGSNTFMEASLSILGSTFIDCGLDSTGTATLDLDNCHVEGDGLNLQGTMENSQISGCMIVGPGLAGIYAAGDSRGQFTGNRIGGFDYGVLCAESTGIHLEQNAIWGNSQGAFVSGGGAAPVLRGNRILYNGIPVSSPEGEDPRPTILIMDNSQPDLGTVGGDPGLNIIRDNGSISLYNASEGTITAVGNDWGVTSEAQVEDLIYHQPDDAGDTDGSGFLSGPVLYSPIGVLGDYPPTPDLDLSGEVDSRDLLLFQKDWHQAK